MFTCGTVCGLSGGAELPQGNGVEGEHAPGLPGHLPPGGAAAQLHRAAGGDGLQPGHPRVEEAAAHRFPRAYAAAAGQSYKNADAAVKSRVAVKASQLILISGWKRYVWRDHQ